MSEVNVVATLKERRNQRFQAMVERVKVMAEMSAEYRNDYADEILADTWCLVKESSVKEQVGQGNTTTSYYNYLDVKHEDRFDFAKKVITGLRTAHDIFVKMEVKNVEVQLREELFEDAIDFVPKKDVQVYEDALDKILKLTYIGKSRKLNASLFETEKDIISCIDYNAKIKKQEDLQRQESDSITDSFIELAIEEEDKELELV